ncbi:hypothetical protein H671_xg20750 [Cricetulus griseus]|uniref:Uncharacterized protein n=1 Tax=Cricetulus griseus TaxID=10029 RepID=A0A061HWJ0_CRIGR|nr:hypothetical protein H671_xg20750 [Cricetulus griseus]
MGQTEWPEVMNSRREKRNFQNNGMTGIRVTVGSKSYRAEAAGVLNSEFWNSSKATRAQFSVSFQTCIVFWSHTAGHHYLELECKKYHSLFCSTEHMSSCDNPPHLLLSNKDNTHCFWQLHGQGKAWWTLKTKNDQEC